MITKSRSVHPQTPSFVSSGTDPQEHHARAFSGDLPIAVDVQAKVRFRERQRSSVITSGVPMPRVRQILASVLALDVMKGVPPDALRVDVHRPDDGRYHNDYGLAVAVAMVSSLARRPVADHLVFLGDVDLHGRVKDVLSARVDRLNAAVQAFEIETPLTIVCATDTGRWINASSTVTVVRASTLADALASTWPGVALVPRL